MKHRQKAERGHDRRENQEHPAHGEIGERPSGHQGLNNNDQQIDAGGEHAHKGGQVLGGCEVAVDLASVQVINGKLDEHPADNGQDEQPDQRMGQG